MFVLCVLSLSVMSDSLRDLANSPGKNTGMRSHSLLQGIFLTQELKLGLPRCRKILYSLTHQGFSGGASGKCRTHNRLRFNPWVRKI